MNPEVENSGKLKSYNITYLVFVAMFGGFLPLMIMGGKNAFWLKVDRELIWILTAIGTVLLLSEYSSAIYIWSKINAGVDATYYNEIKQYVRLGFIVLSILLYFGYRRVMIDEFRQYSLMERIYSPLFLEAILWIVFTKVFELVVLSGVLSVLDLTN